ncbi:MAG: anti-sigma factor [Parvibaculum sp.]|uniref:anti-sigma factor n=1 Tax=Parvibaculum sp. TaxID=2024848 RepID=UPI0027302AA6|nr:anti-sigma factor [Parvibaculum sp.]MDP2149386.1 anti-sigma factor [Parvibaculum sp.]
MSDHPLSDRVDAYVLGLMETDEAARFEAAMEHDAGLREAVGACRDRFVELDLAGPQASVSEDLWGRIAGRIDRADADPASAGTAPPAGAPVPASAPKPAPAPANDNALRRWRRAAMAAAFACVLLAAGVIQLLLTTPEPQVIAILMDETGQPIVMVEDFGNADARVTPLVDYAVPADRTLQLWTLPTQEMGPVSLGLLDGWRSLEVRGPDLPGPREDQLYEITLEPLGGSPTGRPTGPILGKGFAKAPRI